MSETPLLPIARRLDLPEKPLTVADMTGDAPLLLGRLTWFKGARKRPFVAVLVLCPDCGRIRAFPWRWDWGLNPDVVSYQVLRCHDGASPAWVAIDPAHADKAARVHDDAHQAYVSWKEGEAERRTAEKAAKRAAREAAAEKATNGAAAPVAAPEAPKQPPTVRSKPKRPAPSVPPPSNGLTGRLASRRLTTPPTGSDGQPFTSHTETSPR